jgi:hypothetical protein
MGSARGAARRGREARTCAGIYGRRRHFISVRAVGRACAAQWARTVLSRASNPRALVHREIRAACV